MGRTSFTRWLLRCAVAFSTVPAIDLFRWLLAPWIPPQHGLMLFVPAVMFATWYGGLWPGLAAMVLAAFVGESQVTHPAGLFLRANHEMIRTVLFLWTGLQVAIGTELLHRRTREARAASHAKDQFINILSHELRTPLTPALAAAADLAGDKALPDAVREEGRIIQRNIELEVRLIDDLLDISRIQKGKLQLKREIVALDRTLGEVLRTCSVEIEAKGLRIHVYTEQGPFHVNADPARLQQIVWNLLRNAIKFTPAGGSISINIAMIDPATIGLQITDTGIGITPHVLPTIFNSFEQGDPAITRSFGGLGLGLAITRTLVEMHGGTISAASEGAGRGATFVVELPASAFVPSDAPSGQNLARASRKLRILYVEDHAETLRVMCRLLEKLGHEVIGATTVAEGLAIASREPFDLLISDLSLPDGTGVDLLTRLTARGQHPQAIALTGYGTQEEIRRTRAAGFATHLTKPLDVASLQRAIDALQRPREQSSTPSANPGRSLPVVGGLSPCAPQ